MAVIILFLHSFSGIRVQVEQRRLRGVPVQLPHERGGEGGVHRAAVRPPGVDHQRARGLQDRRVQRRRRWWIRVSGSPGSRTARPPTRWTRRPSPRTASSSSSAWRGTSPTTCGTPPSKWSDANQTKTCKFFSDQVLTRGVSGYPAKPTYSLK